MSDPQPPTQGERRLERPPSDRYRAGGTDPTAAAAPQERPVSPSRGVANAAFVAVTGAIAVTILGGVITLTAGLVVAAAILGWAVGLGLKVGAGSTIELRERVLVAIAIAVIGIALGQVGLWLYAGSEGGVLPLVDYLAETFGPLVPLQVLAAAIAAGVSTR